jgi:hypothetical protein
VGHFRYADLPSQIRIRREAYLRQKSRTPAVEGHWKAWVATRATSKRCHDGANASCATVPEDTSTTDTSNALRATINLSRRTKRRIKGATRGSVVGSYPAVSFWHPPHLPQAVVLPQTEKRRATSPLHDSHWLPL